MQRSGWLQTRPLAVAALLLAAGIVTAGAAQLARRAAEVEPVVLWPAAIVAALVAAVLLGGLGATDGAERTPYW